MRRISLRLLGLVALPAILVSLNACNELEVDPSALSWTKATKTVKKITTMKNIARVPYKLTITAPGPETTPLLFKVVAGAGTTCTTGKVVDRTEECKVEVEINPLGTYGNVRGRLTVEGEAELANGRNVRGSINLPLRAVDP